ncbi:hypothetical protein AB82_5146 [Escherichia coli 2-005-03_S3_C1]|nr:hypothetical protein AB82_5146 [Escherichia coli 2-005-03_S3_C1]KDW63366.1 hypothetical protein AC40_5162 [Escherichia coli 2-005-03_S3_C3]
MSCPVHSEVRQCLFDEIKGFRVKVVPQVLQGILKAVHAVSQLITVIEKGKVRRPQ